MAETRCVPISPSISVEAHIRVMVALWKDKKAMEDAERPRILLGLVLEAWV